MNELLLALIAIICINVCINCERLPEWHIKVAQRQGPNTCAVEEVQELRRRLWTQCQYWLRRDVCGYQPVLRYVCCDGYTRHSTQFGCPGVKPSRNLLERARDLGATDFIKYSLDSQIGADLIETHSPLTLFIPTNEAFRNLRGIPRRIFEAFIGATLLHHIIAGRLHTNGTHNDKPLQTLLGGQTIRINKYSNNVFYVNCIAVTRKDQLATNGIIHLIDGVLIPPKSWPLKSVADTLGMDTRFRQLSRLMSETDLLKSFAKRTDTLAIPSSHQTIGRFVD
ncbi:unnamed protein product [Oppiella nova]|uniref:FAS1 domain-containing protein n=1 Tax=Oppiella nova TaxID=334625 RepID=A0A7R9QCR9_9ACAR|nr:unnamed protein product [Oppiella nova]CAG2163195.1 unnamed protein product [Oppiella nova]